MTAGHFSEKDNRLIRDLSKLAVKSTHINPDLYTKYDVKRGLRDVDGKGVPAGLTEISDIISAKKNSKGEMIPCDGELYYRGINIYDIVAGNEADNKSNGFEETAYLLLFGKLPKKEELDNFQNLLSRFRALPKSFVRDIIMKAPSTNMMNSLARSVLSLYYYDNNAENIDPDNVLKQCLQLIAQFPLIVVYSYHALQYYHRDTSLIIHQPDPSLGTAANILRMLRPDGQYKEIEAKILDLLLILHAEHGGGNNSTFTTHLVSSSGTDTYSCMAASLGSLKGPRHGGANIKVCQMFDDIRATVKNYSDDEIKKYLRDVLDKKAFDKAGLIYGMGHAVYSISDPRANIIKKYVKLLADETGKYEEYELYSKIERLAPEIIDEKRKTFKGVSANVDFYSGFVYSMLNIPVEVFTPLFAIARIVGWSAHRIEEISNGGKIIRPGYVAIAPHRKYTPIDER